MSISNEAQEIEALVESMERMTRIGNGSSYEMKTAVDALAAVIRTRAEIAHNQLKSFGEQNV